MNFTTYKNTTIFYSDTGKGTAVVLLHGFLENRKMWNSFLPELSKKHRVICIDLLGHGESGSLGYVHSMEDNADMVYAVLRELRIRKAVLAGHSMGGYVALAFAEYHEDYIKGIILINSTSREDSVERKLNRDRAIQAVKRDYVSFVRLSIANLFSEENREKFTAEIENIKQEALNTPLQGIIAALEGMKMRKDRERLLHNAEYPIALVLGRKDPVLNYDENVLQTKHTDVQLNSLYGGHMSPVENQAELLRIVVEFLKRI